MLLKTLLNRVHPVKGFVYEKDRLIADATEPNGVRIEAHLRPRKGSRGACSGCGTRRKQRTRSLMPFVPVQVTASASAFLGRDVIEIALPHGPVVRAVLTSKACDSCSLPGG